MPSPQQAVSPTLAALLHPLPGGHLRSPEAVRRMVKKAARTDAANAAFARQSGAQAADAFWRDGLAKIGALDPQYAAPEATPAKASGAASADPWSDILAKRGVLSPIKDCRR